MKELTLQSKEFRRVLQNLHLEDLSIPVDKQKKIIEIINSRTEITSSLIKGLMSHGKV